MSAIAEPIDDDAIGELDAQEATSSFDCKRPNCPREARKGRGRYAFLCDFHIDEAKSSERDDAGRSIFRGGVVRPPTLTGVPPREDEPEATEPAPEAVEDAPSVPEPPRAATEPLPVPTLVQLVRELEEPAVRLQTAIEWRGLARDEAREAVAEFNAALKAIRDAASAMLA